VKPNAAAERRPVILATDTSSSFVCDYVAGVNRVLSLPGYLLVDNIGRNFELWHFPPGALEPDARARFDLTSYPGDPIASLLDVDIHAAFLRRDGRELVAVNHYGRARGFELPARGGDLRVAWERQLLGDMERIVMAGDCFIGSSPRGEYTDDPAQPGLFFFAPAPLACEQVLADWGVIDAVTVRPEAGRLVVAAGSRLGVFELLSTGAALRLGRCVWEAALAFQCQWLQIDEAGRLWTGGGGGVQRFGLDEGEDQFTATLPETAAWGYGADPVVLAPDARELYVLGQGASLDAVDAVTGVSRRLFDPIEGEAGAPSLGIGHAALCNGRIYAGFSRGGFRLLRYAIDGR
jgi:hypothetical protein